jgi:D-glycero-D-manno-heptose 1,7-bisphosphate phosphatase
LRKAIFFDRDGTLLVEMGYLTHPSLVRPYHFTAEALRLAREAGFLLVVATNQSGIARGYLEEGDVEAIHERMQVVLAEQGAKVDAVYYCPHHPNGTIEGYSIVCDCRKPAIGMALRAIAQHGIDPARSFVVGDKLTDVGFGNSFGAVSCLVRTGYGDGESRSEPTPGLEAAGVFDNVLEAVRWIVEKEGEGV